MTIEEKEVYLLLVGWERVPGTRNYWMDPTVPEDISIISPIMRAYDRAINNG